MLFVIFYILKMDSTARINNRIDDNRMNDNYTDDHAWSRYGLEDYTHTWVISKRKDQITLYDEALFRHAYNTCKHIVNFYRYLLTGKDGVDMPVITDEDILFQGPIGEKFHLKGSLTKNYPIYWCQTNTPRNPADKVVVLCLWTLAKICPFIRFDSDGGDTVTKRDYSEILSTIGIHFNSNSNYTSF